MKTILRLKRLLVSSLIAGFLATGTSHVLAADFTVYVHERLIDKVADGHPAPSWSGSYGIPGVSFSWSSKLENINFEITSSGIQFSANLVTRVPWGNDTLKFTQAVNGAGYLNFAGSDRIVFGTTHADFPITVSIPLAGTFTVATIRTPLSYSMSYPITPHFLVPAGEDVSVSVDAYDLHRYYENNRIRVTGKTRIW